MERRGSFDYIILETSGLADPGNLAPLFWVDDGLGSSIYLDGVVTLVDAKNIVLSLDEDPAESEEHEETYGGARHLTTAHLQISHADVIVINKCDSVTPYELANVEARIRSINGLATVHKTQYSQIPQLESFLLDLHAYDGIDNLDTAAQGHSHLDPTISTTTLPLPLLPPTALTALETWLRSLLWENTLPAPSFPFPSTPSTAPPPEIHRLKGLAYITTGSRVMIQGVREVFEIVPLDNGGGSTMKKQEDGTGKGKLVLIGRGIDAEALGRSLSGALGGAGASGG
ncbi:hypothetical protein N7G274_006877 [Stereocaulon virgatum]|uniref:CobW-domain-containing protein n=1 Tax=Stereocaulon virgatum TaxID=373712 RepID=A0ABR4A4L3_9LECA